MRNKLGIVSMIMGVVLIVAALSLFLRNNREDAQANEQSRAVLQEMVEAIETSQKESLDKGDKIGPDHSNGSESQPVDADSAENQKIPSLDDLAMKKLLIDGYEYIGYIVIPKIGLELPIMADWDYTRLKIAPCRYSGSTKTNDLVIAGHNYRAHFSKIKDLQPGATVYFTDMDGFVHTYEAVSIDVLTATAVEEMTSGEYDLTLFTCTYGGQSRFALRCDRVTE